MDAISQIRNATVFLFVIVSTMLVMIVENFADYSTAKIVFFGTVAVLLGCQLALQAAVSGRYDLRLLLVLSASFPYLAICASKASPFNAIAAMVVVLMVLLFSSKFEFNRRSANLTLLWISLVLLFHCMYAVMTWDFRQFQSFYLQKNELASNVLAYFFMIFYLLYLELRSNGKVNGIALTGIGLCFFLLYISSSRGALLTAIVFVFIFLGWDLIEKSVLRLWSVFILMVALSIISIPIYLYLSTLNIAQDLNKISMEWTGQLFFSGRNNQWPVFLYLIYLNPWTGYGFDNDFTQWLASLGGLAKQYATFSANNLYLTTALQTGLVGLAAAMVFFAAIWWLIVSYRSRTDVRVAASMFLAYFVHEIFETSLIQGNLQVCIFLWFLIGVSVRELDSYKLPASRRARFSGVDVTAPL